MTLPSPSSWAKVTGHPPSSNTPESLLASVTGSLRGGERVIKTATEYLLQITERFFQSSYDLDLKQPKMQCTGRFSYDLKVDTQQLAFLIISGTKLLLACSHLPPSLPQPSAKRANIFCSLQFWQKPCHKKPPDLSVTISQTTYWRHVPYTARWFCLSCISLRYNSLYEPTLQQIIHQKQHTGHA